MLERARQGVLRPQRYRCRFDLPLPFFTFELKLRDALTLRYADGRYGSVRYTRTANGKLRTANGICGRRTESADGERIRSLCV